MNEYETKFKKYETLLREWNARMNLVAPSTLSDIRGRHINDSAQLAQYLPHDANIIDLGSGAGFPAAVLAILGFNVIAIESIAKKCAFLNVVKQELNLIGLTIVNDRVENALKNNPDVRKILNVAESPFALQAMGDRSAGRTVFTARAFAPLVKIFDLTAGMGRPYLLLKGESIESEIAAAREKYNFDYELCPSETGPGFVVKIWNVKLRKNDPRKSRPFCKKAGKNL